MERTVFLMGTHLHLEVHAATEAEAQALSESIVEQVEGAEARISSWNPSSALRVGAAHAAGTSVELPGPLVALLAEVEEWSSRTGGAFRPDVGALIDAWGLRDGGRRPTAREIEVAVEAVREGTFDFTGDAVVRTAAPTWIDGGGFGKGWALRLAGEHVRATPGASARLDFGGQILWVRASESGASAAGHRSSSPDRWIPLADPHDRSRAALELRVGDGAQVSVATSGNSERGIEVDGVRIGHLLDPRTGHPADFDGAVTVIAVDPMVADLLSTALFVLGPERGRLVLDDIPGVDAIWLHRGGSISTTLEADRFRAPSGLAFATGADLLNPQPAAANPTSR